MLSSLSCEPVDQRRLELKSQNVSEGSRWHHRSSSDVPQRKLISTSTAVTSAMCRHILVRPSILLACLLIAGSQFQYIQARASGRSSPCICKDVFYPKCPPSCLNVAIHSRADDLDNLDSLLEHDNSHPDHIVQDSVDKISKQLAEDNADRSSASLEGDRVVWHRKIYVAEKKEEPKPIIHPIEMTIPITIEDDVTAIIPPPKPIFKMRKYTTYESDPQVEMMPVTTTVIKPVGVPKEQIIEDEKVDVVKTKDWKV